jgi:glycosyltransferase involved in cell wall biosynthesis
MTVVSVITCTRNSVATLPATLSSLAAQVGVTVEHIVVDGYSTDGTMEYVSSESPTSRILMQEGEGIANAMNIGVRAATGDIICHLHSDDYYAHPRVLLSVVKLLDGSTRTWTYGRIVSDIDGAWKAESYMPPPYSFQRLLMRNYVPHPAAFFKASVFERYGVFDEALRFAMDYDFLLRVARAAPPLQTDEVWAVFRRHAGSTTEANRLASVAEDHAVRLRHLRDRPWRIPEAWARYLVRTRRIAREQT